MGQGGRHVRGQGVDAAALVDLVAVHVGIMPEALWHGYYAWNNSIRHVSLNLDFARWTLDANLVPIVDAAWLRIERIDP